MPDNPDELVFKHFHRIPDSLWDEVSRITPVACEMVFLPDTHAGMEPPLSYDALIAKIEGMFGSKPPIVVMTGDLFDAFVTIKADQ